MADSQPPLGIRSPSARAASAVEAAAQAPSPPSPTAGRREPAVVFLDTLDGAHLTHALSALSRSSAQSGRQTSSGFGDSDSGGDNGSRGSTSGGSLMGSGSVNAGSAPASMGGVGGIEGASQRSCPEGGSGSCGAMGGSTSFATGLSAERVASAWGFIPAPPSEGGPAPVRWLQQAVHYCLHGSSDAAWPGPAEAAASVAAASPLLGERKKADTATPDDPDDLTSQLPLTAEESPGDWSWHRPADENTMLPAGAVMYLALIGALTFGVCLVVASAAGALAASVPAVVARAGLPPTDGTVPLLSLSFLLTCAIRTAFAVASFWVVRLLAPHCATGSGIPEMKCVLSGAFMPSALSGRTLGAKSAGLSLALASGMSIGKLGPFVHMSGMIAALVCRCRRFSSLSRSATAQLSAISAAMAAGVGATFGAPLGGVLMSIELMATFYYSHWLPMALYCSLCGYFLVVLFFQADSVTFFQSDFNDATDLHKSQLAKMSSYLVLGILCGVLGARLVAYTSASYSWRVGNFPASSPYKGTALMVFWTVLHTVLCYIAGGVMWQGQKEGVMSMFNDEPKPVSFVSLPGWLPLPDWALSPLSLVIATMLKFFLTGVCLILPVPVGTFMPIFELGALTGRAYGELLRQTFGWGFVDPRATAILGAAGVTTGALHLASVAVVFLELTNGSLNILPLATVSVVAYTVSKCLTCDLFSEIIKKRRLPFLLGGRDRYPSENRAFHDAVAGVTAADVMDRSFPIVWRGSSAGDVRRLLAAGNWPICAVVDTLDSRKLLGSISRWDLQAALPPAPGTSPQSYGATGRPSRHSSSRSRAAAKDAEAEEAEGSVPLLASYDPAVGCAAVDGAPFSIPAVTPYWKIQHYFRMIGMTSIYVTSGGELVGQLTLASFIDFTFSMDNGVVAHTEAERTGMPVAPGVPGSPAMDVEALAQRAAEYAGNRRGRR
ncbi:hypothetical protein MMPV_003527 [Pyropia vietnamensis]